MVLSRFGRIALAALGWLSCCAPMLAELRGPLAPLPGTIDESPALLPGETPPAAPLPAPRPQPTGLLQLLSASEPVLTPAPPAAAFAPPEGQPPLEWVDPYQIGPAAHPAPAWARYFPTGMIPWGPRTALENRSAGLGRPLVTSSWLNRPYSVGWFAGAIDGSNLVAGQTKERGGFFGGYRVGWDYDYYWGLEGRLGGSEISLTQTPTPLTGNPGTAGYIVLDANLLWYPWGDSIWRPYANLGLGVANFAFYDPFGHRYNRALLGVPIGLGLKYRFAEWYTVRFELMDNVAFGGGALGTVNNASLTAGVEFRFGGARRSYWPWNPGRTIW